MPADRTCCQAVFFRQYFPAPNSPGSRYAFSPALVLDTDKFDIKVSPSLSEKDSLVSRYSYANNTESDPAAYPTLGFYPLRSRSQNVGLSYTHIFSPSMAGEFAGNYYRTFFYFLNASTFNGKDVKERPIVV